MRTSWLIVPALLVAAPAAAAEQAPAPTPTVQIPPELTDPANAEKLARVMQVLSKSFLQLPVGELEAAIEGRAPTLAEKNKTLRDEGRATDPNFDRNFQQQMAQSKPMMEAALKALTAAMPAIAQSMGEAGKALERATANMPSPTYPKR